MRACANGQHFPTVMLSVRKAGGGASITYVLSDVLISKVQAGGGGSDNPTESITLSFARMQTQSSGAADTRGPTMAPTGDIRRPGG